MKLTILTNPGLEQLAKQELKELLKVDAKIEASALSFELDEKELPKLKQMQSIRRIVLSFAETKDFKNIKFTDFPWLDFIKKEFTCKMEVENVKGQENRIEIAKKFTEQLFSLLEKEGLKPKIEYKKPDFIFNIYSTGKKYLLGLDYLGKELNSRDYRVFPHSASFKGDLAYYFVCKSGFKKGEELLSGFCKDGAIAIEAARFSGKQIHAFDTSLPNVIAARKNAKLAQVDLKIIKCPLDDLDVKYDKGSFHRIILHLTTKDENKLNEIYYQAKYVLKKGGTLLMIARENWDPAISNNFTLVKKELVHRGESISQLFLLKKN